MKCAQCREKAVIQMRHHRLALCRPHYLDWFVDQTGRTIEKYHMFHRGHKLLVAVSGGKDSLALWDVLWRLGYTADGLYIHLGITGEDDYSTRSEQYARDFAAERGLQLKIINLQETYGGTTPSLAARTHQGKQRPCGVCGLVKRHVMNANAAQYGYDVLVTGHNLDDEASVLFSNSMTWTVDSLRRQAPVLEEAPGLARKAKPLCRFYERETAAYALLRGIEYIEEECPFAVGNRTLYFKEILNRLEAEHPGTKYNYYMAFLHARKNGLFAATAAEEVGDMHRCPVCGQPTTSTERCAFCRLVGQNA